MLYAMLRNPSFTSALLIEGNIMTEKTFCEECRNYVKYTTVSVPMTGRIKGKEYHYIGTEARCADCGSLVFVPEISDDNLRSLYSNIGREEKENS